jgi:hypothetical protein
MSNSTGARTSIFCACWMIKPLVCDGGHVRFHPSAANVFGKCFSSQGPFGIRTYQAFGGFPQTLLYNLMYNMCMGENLSP